MENYLNPESESFKENELIKIELPHCKALWNGREVLINHGDGNALNFLLKQKKTLDFSKIDSLLVTYTNAEGAKTKSEASWDELEPLFTSIIVDDEEFIVEGLNPDDLEILIKNYADQNDAGVSVADQQGNLKLVALNKIKIISAE